MPDGKSNGNSHGSPSGTINAGLDIKAVLSIAETISREMVLDKVIGKILEAALANAGADRAVYLSVTNHVPKVTAELKTGSHDVQLFADTDLEDYANLPHSIVRLAFRSGEPIVVNNVQSDTKFLGDDYIERLNGGAVLCTPVISRSETIGVLYLENSLNSEAFTPGRLDLLDMLSGQLAISLENAKLYTSLEDKVNERTAQLSDTLSKVEALKAQQDGDYFLTSELVKPLSPNKADSKRFRFDFVQNQKKTFKFKKWAGEIGGDLCATHTISLQGKVHHVFINADAMGKSIQGAGGALVLGAVFQTIIERTANTEMKNYGAVKWLRAAVAELHKVFMSFDGQMLISVIAGIVPEEGKMLHFVNAEHPFMVLYREGSARFVDKEPVFPKLGNALAPTTIPVFALPLKPGDVLFFGSDGKDDIMLPAASGHDPQMNEDETLFLRYVEEAEGDLEGVRTAVDRAGELHDDLSIMRIEYRD